MDPCEVHMSRSDSSGLASLGLVTCLACIRSKVAALSWLMFRCVLSMCVSFVSKKGDAHTSPFFETEETYIHRTSLL
jgi:hypothetical protein